MILYICGYDSSDISDILKIMLPNILKIKKYLKKIKRWKINLKYFSLLMQNHLYN